MEDIEYVQTKSRDDFCCENQVSAQREKLLIVPGK